VLFLQVASQRGILHVQLVPESPIIAVNQTLKLIITLSTTTLANSSLSVDFGDNSSTTVALCPEVALATDNTDDSDVHDSGDGIVRIFWDNYRLTCELHIEMLHIYTTDGDSNISVTALATRLEDVTMVKNWTVVHVRSPIGDMSVSVESVVAVQQNFTVGILMSSVSRYLKYHWTVSAFDLMQDGINFSAILSTSTDHPELALILIDVGDYLINVTVDNEISESSVDVIITAAMPVSAVLLSCDGDEYISTNAVFDCVAAVEKGTDVGFVWAFNDGIAVHTTTINGSSTATVMYPAVGRYNITVTAWNQLGAKTAWKTVNIDENVFRLSASATEPVLVGKPVSVMACCVLRSNLSVEVDFGSGSHQLLLDPESSMVTASHVYQLPGVYIVTVKAENSVSVAVTHVLVQVLEHISDVDLKLVSSLIAGRHSVFMATFNGNFSLFNVNVK